MNTDISFPDDTFERAPKRPKDCAMSRSTSRSRSLSGRSSSRATLSKIRTLGKPVARSHLTSLVPLLTEVLT